MSVHATVGGAGVPPRRSYYLAASLQVLVLALMALGAFLTGFMAYYGHIASAVGGGG